ncbi:hypothetical protein ACFIJ5_18510 (plasmid) [Haloimpatiens sp. FM7330]|uniref:hypothetical protein n=1 Tax=Haloimpatiens sp. FM7330 TaxID=3298610 RepID=UPI00362DAC51
MTLNYTITKEQLLNFHEQHILSTLKYKKFSTKMRILYFLISILILVLVEYRIKFKVFIGLIIVGIIIFVFRKKIYINKFHNQIVKVYYDHKKKYLFNQITLEINNSGIKLNTSMNYELIKWKGIKDFNIIDNNIFIRTFTKDNVFIPSYAIKSQEELELLKDLFFKYGEIKPKYNYPRDIEFILK